MPIGKPYHQTGYVYRIPVQQRWTPGEYQVAIGPNVTDLVNNPMNQDGDLVNGEAEEDVFRGQCVLVDVFPPAITEIGPLGLLNQAVSELRLRFTEPIDPTTFRASDLSLVGPSGPIDLSAATISVVEPHGSIRENQEFTVAIPLLAEDGQYLLTVTSRARDPLGNTAAGERLTSRFTLDTTDAAVVGIDPTGDVGHAVDTLEIRLSEPIQQNSLTSGRLALTGPLGPVGILGVEFVDSVTCRVRVATQRINGQYSVLVMSGLVDPAGNVTDTPWTGTFSIKLPDFAAAGVMPGAYGDFWRDSWSAMVDHR